MATAGFRGAVKTWENSNSRGDRVACYELAMLPRLRSGALQIISGPSTLSGNQLLWKMTPGLPDTITPSASTGIDAVFRTEMIAQDDGDGGDDDDDGGGATTIGRAMARASALGEVIKAKTAQGGSILLLQSLSAEVAELPVGATSRTFEISQPLTDVSLQTSFSTSLSGPKPKALSLSSAVCVLVINFDVSTHEDVSALLAAWEAVQEREAYGGGLGGQGGEQQQRQREGLAFGRIPGLICKAWLQNVATNTFGGCYFWDSEERMMVRSHHSST